MTGPLLPVLRAHAKSHPEMRVQDAVKLVYQNEFGGGHLITDERASLERLQAEMAATPLRSGAALTEPVGGGRVRLNLAAAGCREISPGLLNRIFVLSSAGSAGRHERFVKKLRTLRRCAEEGVFAFTSHELDVYLRSYEAAGFPPVHHSDAYRAACSPAYRVIDERFVRLLPVIAAAARLPAGSVLAIDGCAASGKTTAAQLLGELFCCPVIHMDDFFLPAALRTPQRLGEPGGNIHYERFASEVLPGLRMGQALSYRVFDCSRGCCSSSREILPAALHIVEGAYSLHPRFGDYCALRVFCHIAPEKQKKRILARSGPELLKAFTGRWIPMENRYFEHYGIRESCDFVLC
ncbi:uridine kinase family protein [Feifania hominis]|nr:hypothetical protein [Feifania hominis]